jgi:hypothetical protein
MERRESPDKNYFDNRIYPEDARPAAEQAASPQKAGLLKEAEFTLCITIPAERANRSGKERLSE